MPNKKKNYEKILGNFFIDSKDDKKCHYVYALCDQDNKVFYVGEGTGSRCLDHKNAFSKEIEEIEKLQGDEKDQKRKELDKKKQKIEEIGADNVKHVILKYGLSQEEGFIAESAIINSMKFIGVNLTNILNGHATEKEKGAKSDEKTKARDLETFARECAPEPLNIQEIDKNVLRRSVFISINRLAPCCNNDFKLLWDATRASWHMNFDRANDIRYIFSINNQVVKAVFEVEPGKIRKVFSGNNTDMPTEPNEESRKLSFDLAQQISKLYSGRSEDEIVNAMLDNEKNKEICRKLYGDSSRQLLEKKLRTYLKHIYFSKDLKNDEMDDLNGFYRDKMLIVNGNDFKMPQSSFVYGERFL